MQVGHWFGNWLCYLRTRPWAWSYALHSWWYDLTRR